jgi:hypothetical protein
MRAVAGVALAAEEGRSVGAARDHLREIDEERVGQGLRGARM